MKKSNAAFSLFLGIVVGLGAIAAITRNLRPEEKEEEKEEGKEIVYTFENLEEDISLSRYKMRLNLSGFVDPLENYQTDYNSILLEVLPNYFNNDDANPSYVYISMGNSLTYYAFETYEEYERIIESGGGWEEGAYMTFYDELDRSLGSEGFDLEQFKSLSYMNQEGFYDDLESIELPYGAKVTEIHLGAGNRKALEFYKE